MATSTIGRIRFNPRNAWVSATLYAVDDIVFYKNKYYVCTVANSSTTTPDLNTSQMSVIGGGMFHVGEWSNATAYAVNDTVTFTRDSAYGDHYSFSTRDTYICIQAHTNQNPSTATTFWKMISEGAMRDKFAFAAFPNEGYVDKSDWDTWALSTTVGMGDSFGTFKAPGGNTTNNEVANVYCYVNKRRNLVVFGNYPNGMSGLGSTRTIIRTPTEVPFTHNSWIDGVLTTPDSLPPKIVQVEGKPDRGLLVLFNNGEVHWCGPNAQGQAGNGTTTAYNFFTQCGYANVNIAGGTTVLRDKRVIRIASTSVQGDGGNCTNFALVRNSDNSRELYSWGYNVYGQAGDNTQVDRLVPTLVTFDQATHGRIIEIWASGGTEGNFFLLTETGKMFARGYNAQGQLGIGSPTATTNWSTDLALVKDWGTGAGRIKKFTTGGAASATSYIVVRANGEIWGWGAQNGINLFGQGSTATNNTVNWFTPLRLGTTAYTGTFHPNGQTYEPGGRTVSFSGATANPTTDQITVTNYPFWANDPVVYNNGGNANIGGLVSGTTYFVLNVNQSTLQLSATAGGAAINLTSSGTGTHTLTYNPFALTAPTYISDAYNAWISNSSGFSQSYVARGTSNTSNTLFGAGNSNTRALSYSINGTVNQSLYVNVTIAGGANMTNVVDLTISGPGNNDNALNETSIGIKRSDNQWYFGGASRGTFPIGHGDQYNSRTDQDPNRTANDFRFKANGLYPRMHSDKKYLMFRAMGGGNQKYGLWADLRTGRVYHTSVINTGQSNTSPASQGVIVGTPQTLRNQ